MNEELSKLIDDLVAKGASEDEIDVIVQDYISKNKPATQQPKSLGFFGSIGEAFSSMFNAAQQERDPNDPQPVDPFVNAVKRGVASGEQADILNMKTDVTPEGIERLSQLQSEQKLPSSEAFQKFNSSKTFKDAAYELASNPATIILELTAQSLASQVSHGAPIIAERAAEGGIIGGLTGSVVPGIGNVAGFSGGIGSGFVSGMAETSLDLEYAGKFIEVLQESGVDVENPEDLQRAFSDEALMDKARTKAQQKAIPIALFDLLSGGLAGKISATPAKNLVTRFAQGAGEFAVQGALGGVGELAGEVVSGEEINPAAIIGEMVGELGTTPVEVAVGVSTINKKLKEANDIIEEVGDTGDPQINAEIDNIAELPQPQKEELVQEQITQDIEEKNAEQEAEFKATESEVIANLEQTEEEIKVEKQKQVEQDSPEYKDAIERISSLSKELQNPTLTEEESREVYGRLAEAKRVLLKIAPLTTAKPENSTKKKTPIKKRIEDTTGVTKPEKSIKMTPNEAIKHQVQTFYRGMQEGVYKGKDLTNDLVVKVQEAIKESPLSPKQVSTILTKVRNTNLFTPGSVSKLNDFIDKVTTDAEYADSLSEAKSTNKKIRKALKSDSIPQNYKGIAKAFASINPEEAIISPHLEWAGKILNSLKSPSNPNYEAMNINEAEEYISDLQEKIAKVEEQRTTSEPRGDTRNINSFAALESSLNALEAKDTSEFDDNELKVINTLKSLDPQTLNDSQANAIVRVIDNIVENDDFSNASKVEAIAKSKQNLKELKSKVDKSKLKDIGTLGRLGASTYQQFSRIFGDSGFAAEVQRAVGILDVFNAGSRVENQENKFKEGLEQVVKKAKKKFKVNAIEPINQIRLVIFSELYRNYGDDSHISKVKNNIERTIGEYTVTDPQTAEDWKKAYADFKDVTTVDELPSKLNKGLMEVWKYVNSKFTSEINPRLQKVAVELHNKPYVEAQNYTHSKQVATTDTKAQKETATGPAIEGKTGVRPQQSTTAIKATRNLRPGHAYASEFFTSQIEGFRESLFDIEASRAEELAAESIYTPEFVDIVGGEHNAAVVRGMYWSARRIQRGSGRPSNEAVRALNTTTQFIRNLGSVRALGSATQFAKQVPSVWMKAAFNHMGTGSLPQFFQGIRAINLMGSSKGLQSLFDMYSIGVRGQRLGGIERGNSLSFRLDPGTTQKAVRLAEYLREKSEWLSRKSLYVLTKSDVYAARTTWLGYYLQSLKEQGITELNLHTEFQKQGEESRQKAAAFAEQMISETQVPSNPATLSQLVRNENDGAYNFVKNLLIPFSTFSSNAKYRQISNWDKFLRNKTWKNGAQIVGDNFENLVFASISFGLLSYYKDFLRATIEQVFDLGEGGDDEKDEMNRKKGFYNSLINASVPFSIGTAGESATAKIANGLAYIVENPDVEYSTWKKETGGFIFDPSDRAGQDYGLIGLGIEPFKEAKSGVIDLTKSVVLDQPVQYEAFGNTQSVDLTEEQKKLLAFKTMMEMANLAGINEADLFNQVRKVYKEQLKEAKSRETAPKPKIIIR